MKVGEDPKDGVLIAASDIYVIDSESVSGTVEGLVSRVWKANADARFLVLIGELNEKSAFPLLNIGIKGLMTHDQIAHQLARALEAIAGGGYWVPRNLLATFVDTVVTRSRSAGLAKAAEIEVSRREKEVIDCLLQNLSNKEIASKLNISERTVKFHVSNLLTKFNVQRRADLILLWYQKRTQESHLKPGQFVSTRRVQ